MPNAELSAVSNFIAGLFPPAIQQKFKEELAGNLSSRYNSHWHRSNPEIGSAFRSLMVSSNSVDSSILKAGFSIGLGPKELRRCLSGTTGGITLGQNFTIWVDPGCVSLRVEKDNGAREGTFIEIYGRLPPSLHPRSLHSTVQKSSLNIDEAIDSRVMDLLISPTKRSKAISIVAPPTPGLSAMGALLLSTSPLPRQAPGCSSPFITPPTPLRPLSTDFAAVASDVFSHQRTKSIGLGAPVVLHRRGSFRNSSCDGSGSDGESGGHSSAGSSIFSLDSISSSATSLGGLHSRQRSCSGNEVVMDGEFKYPPIPTRNNSIISIGSSSSHSNSGFVFPSQQQQQISGGQHSRSHSFSSAPPSPTKSAFGNNSVPNSPSKQRRRGTRGAGSSHHESTSSISSITSLNSQLSTTNLNSIGNPIVNPRTRAQALAGTLTEHSGGKVVVLGGGVLLGLASSGGADNKRRGRDRRVRARSGTEF